MPECLWHDMPLDNGIGVQVNYMPANWHPVFGSKNLKSSELATSVDYYEKQISLPMHNDLSDIEQEFIATTLLRICSSLKN